MANHLSLLIPYQEYIGSVAAFLTTACWVPQVWHILKTRDVTAISLRMYVLFTVGVGFSLAYGILLPSPPLVVASIITFLLSATIVVLKIKWSQGQ